MSKTKRVRFPFKAFKAFDKDLKCIDFQYKIGGIYKHKGVLELCGAGFHASRKCSHVFNYYAFDPRKTRVCEVTIKGDIIEGEDKFCCSELKILRELTWNEVLNICNIGFGNSGNRNSGNGNSGNENSGNWNSGNWNSGNWNSGNWNSGNYNSGNLNSGNLNSGNWNSGYNNSGNYNSGNRNSGYNNSGNGNSGNGNSGYNNSGNGNSGNGNSGNENSGNWNACNGDKNYLSTEDSEFVRVFNKPCKRSVWESTEIPQFFYFNLTEWVVNKSKTEDGYLKTYDYKEAWQNSWNNATEEDRKLVEELPNFDWEIFTELTGIEKPEEW